MLLDIPFVADLIQLRHKRQVLIHHNLRRENNRHHNFDSIVGNYVFEILKMGLSDSKLGLKTRGPYRIEQVHANGTFTIHRRPGVIDRVNIRRLRPAYTRWYIISILSSSPITILQFCPLPFLSHLSDEEKRALQCPLLLSRLKTGDIRRMGMTKQAHLGYQLRTIRALLIIYYIPSPHLWICKSDLPNERSMK